MYIVYSKKIFGKANRTLTFESFTYLEDAYWKLGKLTKGKKLDTFWKYYRQLYESGGTKKIRIGLTEYWIAGC